jgi:hypothetical protein
LFEYLNRAVLTSFLESRMSAKKLEFLADRECLGGDEK